MSNLEILAYEASPLGALCLRRRELLSQPGVFVTEVTLNHEFLMSSLYTDSEETLARVALQRVEGDGLRVLVGGLGLGYTAHAALSSDRVAHVEVIDLLPEVIGWMREGLVPLSEALGKATTAGRLTLTEGDAYARLAEAPAVDAGAKVEQFDAILIDIDHSPDERLDEENSVPFYTAAGLRAARRRLAPGGVLAVWSYAESGPFADALREVFDEVTVEPVSYDNEMIHERRTDWLFFARG